MFARLTAALSFLAILIAGTALAQDTEIPMPEMSEPTEAHKWLHQLEGEWTATMSAGLQEGSMSCKMLGGFWLINNFSADMGGGQMMNAIQTIGYDEAKKKYVGSWVDSMMNHFWIYEGTVDETGKKIMLEADGPNLLGGEGTMRYRDSYEIKSPDQILQTSEYHDGEKWVTFMTIDIRRKK
jgi:Protein of unknown function (DUF1579)